MSPLPKFEFEDTITPEDKVDKEALQTTLQKLNELNFKDVQFGSIRPGAGSVIEGSLIVKGSVEPEKLTGLGDLAYEDAVEKAKLGATIIDGGYIVTGMINASRIDTGTLSADRLSVTELNALEITAGSVAAEDITGNTITGKTIRTAIGRPRIQMDVSTHSISFWDNSDTYPDIKIEADKINFQLMGVEIGTPSSSLLSFKMGSDYINFGTGPEISAYGSTITIAENTIIDGSLYPDNDNTQHLGGFSNRWDQVHIGGNLVISGEVTGHLIPSESTSDLGSSTDPWDQVYVDTRLVMLGSSSSRSFLRPDEADGSNLGTSTYYWHQVFADLVRYKDLASFDHIDDLEAIKAVNIKTIEREGPDDIDSEGNVIRGKKYKKDVWDTKTLPKDVVEGEFIDANAMNGLVIGSLKELITKVESLESQLQELKNNV